MRIGAIPKRFQYDITYEQQWSLKAVRAIKSIPSIVNYS